MPAGLPHYRNSQTSMNNWEPVYTNLFQVVFTPPSLVSNWNYVVENITKVSGLTVDQQPGQVAQKFKGASRTFAGALPDTTTVDISIDFNVNLDGNSNSMFTYKALKKWTDLIWDPLTGASLLKKDYVGGPLVISLYNKIGQVTRQWTFPQVYPTKALNAIDLAYETGNNIYAITGFTFRADYWDDVSL